MVDANERIAETVRSGPDERIMEWAREWWTRGQLADFAARLEGALASRGIQPEMTVALVARNRPSHCFAFAALLAARRSISMLYPFQSAESLARDVTGIRVAALVLDERDWSEPVARAIEEMGTIAILLAPLPDGVLRVVEPARCLAAENAHRLPEPGIEVLSSGTTGLPKRIFHPLSRLGRALEHTPPQAGEGPDMVVWPVSGIGGAMTLCTSLLKGNSFILIEKFTVEEVVDAIRRHRLKSFGATPTMLRMLDEANVPAEHLESLEMFRGGSGPLDLELRDRLEARYGKPIIWAMGASEFAGTIISWTPELYSQFGNAKRGSSGRLLPGCALRIVDPETDVDMPQGETGRVVVRVDAVGPDWIVTNDLARVDEDGFVFFEGRADGAINRGGFKIVPEKLCETLRLHPKVAEAAVVGVPDPRVGQVPVAVVEPMEGQTPGAAELDAHMRAHLPAPQIPAHYFVVDKLPYTASTKVAVAQVCEMVTQMMAEVG